MPVSDSSSEQAEQPITAAAEPVQNWRARRELAVAADFGLRADPQLGRVTEIMRAEAAHAARRLTRARRAVRSTRQSA